jgi:hypothetical protein
MYLKRSLFVSVAGIFLLTILAITPYYAVVADTSSPTRIPCGELGYAESVSKAIITQSPEPNGYKQLYLEIRHQGNLESIGDEVTYFRRYGWNPHNSSTNGTEIAAFAKDGTHTLTKAYDTTYERYVSLLKNTYGQCGIDVWSENQIGTKQRAPFELVTEEGELRYLNFTVKGGTDPTGTWDLKDGFYYNKSDGSFLCAVHDAGIQALIYFYNVTMQYRFQNGGYSDSPWINSTSYQNVFFTQDVPNSMKYYYPNGKIIKDMEIAVNLNTGEIWMINALQNNQVDPHEFQIQLVNVTLNKSSGIFSWGVPQMLYNFSEIDQVGMGGIKEFTIRPDGTLDILLHAGLQSNSNASQVPIIKYITRSPNGLFQEWDISTIEPNWTITKVNQIDDLRIGYSSAWQPYLSFRTDRDGNGNWTNFKIFDPSSNQTYVTSIQKSATVELSFDDAGYTGSVSASVYPTGANTYWLGVAAPEDNAYFLQCLGLDCQTDANNSETPSNSINFGEWWLFVGILVFISFRLIINHRKRSLH